MDRRICIPLFTPLLDYGRLRKLMDSKDTVKINNNYSPKWRWLVLDIYGGRETAR